MSLSNKMYDVLKFIAQIFLPALGTLYLTIGGIYDFKGAYEPEHVVAVIVAVDTFLGVLLGISTKLAENSGKLYDGTIRVDSAPEQNNVNVDFHKEFEEYNEQKEVRLKVLPTAS